MGGRNGASPLRAPGPTHNDTDGRAPGPAEQLQADIPGTVQQRTSQDASALSLSLSLCVSVSLCLSVSLCVSTGYIYVAADEMLQVAADEMDFAYADEFVRALDSSNTPGALTSSRKHQHPCRGEVLPPTPAFQPSLLPAASARI